jgi:hypothetical protein
MTIEEKRFKVRENMARRRLAKQGFRLIKNRGTSNPYNIGGYMIANSDTNFIEFGAGGHGFSLDLDDVEEFINQ